MYLKSLVLKGFKSFADRSVLAMQPGITAIVGPNGSGKSNISDAVLWVLGERNAKHLRGQAMEDVIFAGSSARKATSVAEVDLVLDNSDGTLPVDFSEVSITRRMYRSGESEYLINGTVARRMDVLDILHDSGLGTGTHSIISQGSLDSVLQSRPEDRRALIEEAAGVLKHKQRKAKSERKLAGMDAHLARVRDVAAEVNRQLGPLERKAKRARLYEELSAQLSDLKLALAVDDVRALQRSWDAAKAHEHSLDVELEQKRAAVSAAEAKVEQLQEKIRVEGADAGALTRNHGRAQSAVERFDGAVMLLHEKRRAAQDAEAQLAVQLAQAESERTQAQAERDQAKSQLAEVSASRAAADEKREQLARRRAENADERRGIEREVEQLEREQKQAQRERDDVARRLAQTQEELASGLAHVKLVEARRSELESTLEHAQEQATQAARAAQEAEAAQRQAQDAEAAARARVAAALSTRDEARTALDAVRDEVALAASEIKGLQEAERSSHTAGPARTWLLDHANEAQGALAQLAHEVRAPKQLEALVERLLGDDVTALLADDDAAAAFAAGLVAHSAQQGGVVLMPRDARVSDAPARQAAAAGLGRALIDELTVPKGAQRAVEALVGDVVVCESREQACAAHERDTFGVRLASPDGCVVWPSGKVVVGQPVDEGQEGVLSRARRLEEVQRTHADAVLRRDEASQKVDAAEEELRTAQAASLKASQGLAELRGAAAAARTEATAAQSRLDAAQREAQDVERQHTDAQQAVEKARPSVEKLKARSEELDSAQQKRAARLDELQQQVVPLRKTAGQLRDELADAKLKAATLAERQTYTTRVVAARERDLETLAARDASQRASRVRKQVAHTRVEPLLAALSTLAEDARSRALALERAASAAQSASEGLHASVTEARAAAHDAREALDDANARMAQARVDKGRLEVQVENAVTAITRDLGTPLEQALELEPLQDRPQAEEQAGKLSRRIANMGTINPDAAQEFEQVKARHDYLQSQLADLEGARRSLSKIVRVIDARMRDDFVKTFEAVDENFAQIFGVLFPGGTAHLSLSDPDNLEETGIDVTAQPRGKRIAKMTLMSGGEKSLTAIALLFAVYRIRSAPFYILDEVEAALDDTNLRRLTAYLNSLRDSTQLIMITHQRRTMEMADVLFGVSMQADGVTKVISQRLDHALQYAEG